MTSSVRDLRALAGLTQIQLAYLSGIERSRLSLLECGHVELSAEELEAVNKILHSAIRERVKKYASVTRKQKA